MKGCNSCTWLTRSVPPQARPRYQAKKPIHIENTATYAEATATTRRLHRAPSGHCVNSTGSVTGSASTSTHEIVCSGAHRRADRTTRARR